MKQHNPLLWAGGYCALPLACILVALLFLSRMLQRPARSSRRGLGRHEAPTQFKPQMQNDLFADERDSRRPPEGVVARGHMAEDSRLQHRHGRGDVRRQEPVPVTMELLKQGQMKFTTYCSPCHDRTGSGQGIVPIHAPSWQPANLMEDRVVQFADGDIFNVIIERPADHAAL